MFFSQYVSGKFVSIDWFPLEIFKVPYLPYYHGVPVKTYNAQQNHIIVLMTKLVHACYTLVIRTGANTSQYKMILFRRIGQILDFPQVHLS